MPPRGSARTAAARPGADGRTASWLLLGRQRQVDLLQRRPPHLEPFELASLGERASGQLVQRARRLLGLHHELPAVLAVANLRRRPLARPPRGSPERADPALA